MPAAIRCGNHHLVTCTAEAVNGPVRPAVSKGAAMSIAHSLAAILQHHVTLEVESIDRLDLNAYVPRLQ